MSKKYTIAVAGTGTGYSLIFKPLPGDDPKRRQANTSLVFMELKGWKAKMGLEEGLGKTISYFKGLL